MADPGRIELPVITATAVLRLGDEQFQVQMSAPDGPARLADLLPQFRALADAVVSHAVEETIASGQQISCKKGCGACCRQLVPITEVEARRLAEFIAAMPEPRQSTIRARFAAALTRLESAGVLDLLRRSDRLLDEMSQSPDPVHEFGLRYFQLGIPCPFLEEESCSIYEERPIACREYLVTSPAENCAQPKPYTIHCVPIPLKVARAINMLGLGPGARMTRWVPLILLLEWAAVHPDEPPRPGREILREWFECLTGQRIPPAKPNEPSQP